MNDHVPPPAHIQHAGDISILATIHLLENPTNSRRPGRNGELGPYQFLRSTWEHLTTLPFTPEYVCDPDISRAVAVLHLAEIRLALVKSGRSITPNNLAACWNCGATRFLSNLLPLTTLDYVARFNNLYYGNKN